MGPRPLGRLPVPGPHHLAVARCHPADHAGPHHRVRRWPPLDFAPGSRYAYSNYGYLLLGLIVEKASGMAYESYVKQKILAPAGVTRMRLGRTLKAQAAPGEIVYESAQTSRTVTDASGAIVPAPTAGSAWRTAGPAAAGWPRRWTSYASPASSTPPARC
ncbi:serine hydrolase [Nonomuraea rubra]|uniref:serine hydrolase n=1 Tax=Nonomuraea rubra TaxID=46180 RepID=UPI00361D82C6